MDEDNFSGDFDILDFVEDTELEQLFRNGVLSDIPTYYNSEITATQVFGISTQDLISAESNPEAHGR